MLLQFVQGSLPFVFICSLFLPLLSNPSTMTDETLKVSLETLDKMIQSNPSFDKVSSEETELLQILFSWLLNVLKQKDWKQA